MDDNLIYQGVEVVNLTPRRECLCTRWRNSCVLPPSGTVARCVKSEVKVGSLNGMDIMSVQMGEVFDLLEPRENTVFIVSRITASAVPERSDVLCTNGLVRDDEGRPIGCTSFRRCEPNRLRGHSSRRRRETPSCREPYENRSPLFEQCRGLDC